MELQKYIQVIAETGKRDFYYFCKEIVGLELIKEIPHKKMCDDAMTWGKNMRDWLYPRDTFKTTILVVCYALWIIVKDPNITILLTSNTLSNSMKSLRAIKNVIESNKMFIDCYGDLKKEPGWTDNEITVSTRTHGYREPTIMTGGVDSSKTGFHYRLILFDDPHDEKNTGTPDALRKVISYYQNMMPQLDSVHGQMQITATRWHHLDIHNHIFTYEKESFDIYISPALWQDKEGNTVYFFPDRLNPEFLAKRKLGMGSYKFSLQYLNNPLDDENAPFKQSQFRHFNVIGTDDGGKAIKVGLEEGGHKVIDFDELHFFVSVDPAGRGTISEVRLLDYSAFVVVAVDNEGYWYVMEAIRKKGLQPSQMIEKIINLMLEYRPEMVGIESVTYQGQIKYGLDKKLEKMKLDTHTHVCELKHGNRIKANRILGLQPLYESGRIHHRQNLLDLEDELIHWSLKASKHDDVIDALAYVRDMVYEPELGYTRKPPAPKERVELHESPGLMIVASEAFQRSGQSNTFQEFLEDWDPYEDDYGDDTVGQQV